MLVNVRMLTKISNLRTMVTHYLRCYSSHVLTKVRFSVTAAIMLFFPVVLGLCLFMVVIMDSDRHSDLISTLSIMIDIGPMNL